MLETLQSSPLLLTVTTLAIVSCWVLSVFLKRDHRGKNLPGGSLGFPLIGESISFTRAMSQNRGEEWIAERVAKYGRVFKTSLAGYPTVVILGQAGNKFVLGSGDDVIAALQPRSVTAVAGKYSLFELPKTRYMFYKEAMIGFLKPASLQNHVKGMDNLVVANLLRVTKDTDTVMAENLMKKIMFDIACEILFGIYEEQTKESLLSDFTIAFRAFWSIPINFPGTVLRKGIDARQRIIDTLTPIMKKKKEDVIKGIISPKSDVIACLMSAAEENEDPVVKHLEVMDIFISLMIATHDTSACLSTLMIWKLARDQDIYKRIREEHMVILNGRGGGEEQLTWNELQKMKYTWRVAQELLRVMPIVFCSFRKVVEDTQFAGYDIPKGWQVVYAACGTHMDKDIFDDPTTFNPSRFESPSKPIPPYTYIPFGAGTHGCIGNEFSRIAILTVIHHLVTKFEWSQLHPDELITRKPMPYPSMGLPIKLKKIQV